MPASIAIAAASAAISTVVSVGFANFTAALFLRAFATNIIIGVISKALSSEPTRPSLTYDSAARTQSVRQPITPWRVVYGTDRVSGAITFIAPMVGQNHVMCVMTLACHRSKSIRNVYFNDQRVPLVETGSHAGNATGKYGGYTRVLKSLGTEAGQPFPDLVGNSGGKWKASSWQKGHTKLYPWFYRDRNIYSNGIPNVTAVVDGYDYIYDPRTTSYGFTSNPALVLADYLTNPRFNKHAVAWADLDETAVTAAANICDERISVVYQPAITVTAGTDTVTFAADETQLKTGDAVKYVTTGGAAGGLTNGNLYYFIRTDTDAGQLAASRANALAGVVIDLTSAGSGTQTLERMPVFTAAAETDTLTFEADEPRMHRGDGVRLETTGTLPTGLSTATTYYVIPVSEAEIQLATTYANAFAGTAINLTSTGSGVHRVKPYDEVRYATNGSFTLDQKPQDIIDQLCAPMAGRCTKIGAAWRITAGAYTAPSITFTDSEMDGPRQVQVMPGRDQSANAIKGVFVGPENFYQPTDFVPVTNATYLTVDNNERVWKDAEFTMVRRQSLARRLAKIELERIRQGLVLTIQGKLSTYRAQPGDIVGVTVSRYGWSNKAFEVINSKLVLRGQGDNIRFGVDHLVRETDAGIYTWAATENSAADIAPNTTLPDPFQLASQVPQNVSGLEVFNQGNDTSFTGRDCKVAWRRSSAQSYFEFGSEPDAQGLGAGRLDDWFAGWVVRVYKTDGTLLREEPPSKEPVYVYTYEKNFEDTGGTPLRTFVIKVWGKTDLGKESAIPAQLTVANAAPTASAPTVSASVKGVKFRFDKPSDTDWYGFKVWGSTSNGFTANSSTLLYSGVDTEFVVGNLTTGVTFYYRYAATDAFGDGSTSTQASTTPGVDVDTEDLADNAATKITSSLDTSKTHLPDGEGDNILCNWTTITPDLSNQANVYVEAAGTFTMSAAADMLIRFNITRLYVTARYTTGTITSLSNSGASSYLNGSGTSWLSAGFTAGDRIILANGRLVCSVISVISDTQIQIGSFGGGAPFNGYSGSYIGFKSGGASTIMSWAEVDIAASKTYALSAPVTDTTSTTVGVTEQVYLLTATPSVSIWSATKYLTQNNVLVQAFVSTR